MPQLFYVVASGVALSLSFSSNKSSAAPAQSVELSQLADRLHIIVQINHECFPFRGKCGLIEASNPDSKDLALYLPLFFREFALYPQEVISQSGLRKIILCKNLKSNGQAVAGLADRENQVLYLDIGIIRDFPASFLSATLHHEFFHIMDSKDGDGSWSSLNEPGFIYGTDGNSAKKNPTMFMMNYALVGFLNRYSMSAVEEDRAEMFANMMIDYGRVKERTEWDDPILEAKFLQMKIFLQKFCPSFNDAFWAKRSKRINS